MVSTKPNLSVADYYRIERAAETRSEYLNGSMIAMPSNSIRHTLIKTNLVCELGQQVKGRQCRVFSSDLRYAVLATGLRTYPDVSVICGEIQFDAEDTSRETVTNPTLLAEVISEQTEAYDRGKKFAHYRRIGSLREYLLVCHDEPRVERYSRNTDNTWTLAVSTGMSGSVELHSVDAAVSLTEIYRHVELPAMPKAL